MSNLNLLKSINNIDDDLIKAADEIPIKKHMNSSWIKFVSLVASICIIAILGIITLRKTNNTSNVKDNEMSFELNGIHYEHIDSGEVYKIEGDDMPRIINNVDEIGMEDLGSLMGVVILDSKEYKVYHYASYPNSNIICVIEVKKGRYQFFVAKE